MTTTKITAQQAALLNKLNQASSQLAEAANDLVQRAHDVAEKTANGHHLTGFDSDILGQCGREVQHYASVRSTILAMALGCPEEALMKALTHRERTYLATIFAEGQEYADKIDQ
jgi:hypothetical protein